MSLVQAGKKPLIIAHRGASLSAPENTIAAFSNAIADGAEGIEFDVRMSKDGVPIVFHDSNLLRIAGKDVRVSTIRYSELSEVDVGSWFNTAHPALGAAAFSMERIPTLTAVMDLLAGFAGAIYVELKGANKDMSKLAAAVGKVLAGYSNRSALIVKSFNLEAVLQVRAVSQGIETAALFKPNIMRLMRKESQLINIAKEMEFDRLSIHFSLASKKLMKLADAAGMPVTIWTVDSPRWIKRSIMLGIDSIITNDPAGQLEARERVLIC